MQFIASAKPIHSLTYLMEEESTYVHMENPRKIMRRSIHTFLKKFEYFTTIPLLLILPFSASVLLSQALSSSSSPLLLIIHACFEPIFHPSSQFLSLLNSNLSQNIFTSVFSLVFALTSLVIGKLLIIQTLIHHKSSFPLPFSSFMKLYKSQLLTQLCNSVLIVVVSAAAFSLLFVAFNTLESFGFSKTNPLALLVAKAVFYSILANVSLICNLALVVAGLENCTGFRAIYKACLLCWTRNSIALSMNLPINLGILAVEGLFRYRVVRAYHLVGRACPSMAFEGMFIACLYSILVVLDTIASCLFFKSIKATLKGQLIARDSYHCIV
ncbi:unnamed protein product [Camellia sinensis]